MFETPVDEAFGYLEQIRERQDAAFRQQAALHGVEIDSGGGVRRDGRTGLRGFHDRLTKKIRGH